MNKMEDSLNSVNSIYSVPHSGIVLSILTPAVPSRLRKLDYLCDYIARQVGQLPVEHLVLIDNKKRTVGEKRDALIRAARGDYVAFVDDDDLISDEYVDEILKASKFDPQVITFCQKATVNDQSAIIKFRLGNPNAPFVPGTVVKRNAWHVCAWRRELAVQSFFPASNYGEDWAFAAPLCAFLQKLAPTTPTGQDFRFYEVHIDKVLHYYQHDEKLTEAPPPGGVSLANDSFHVATGV